MPTDKNVMRRQKGAEKEDLGATGGMHNASTERPPAEGLPKLAHLRRLDLLQQASLHRVVAAIHDLPLVLVLGVDLPLHEGRLEGTDDRALEAGVVLREEVVNLVVRRRCSTIIARSDKMLEMPAAKERTRPPNPNPGRHTSPLALTTTGR